jgi:benzil reductase ((S)-benzoin forming)
MQHIDQCACLITGASRGLGAALARRLDRRGAALFLVARGRSGETFRDAEWLAADLSELDTPENVIKAFAGFVEDREPRCLMLINNAGTVAPISPAERADRRAVARAMRLNLVAPMVLTGSFIRRFADAAMPKLVVNVSSGAASSPYAGWSTYCAGKAGLDHYTRCVDLEQKEAMHPATVIALAPGIVDTAMQEEIRAAGAADFPMIGKFTALKESGDMPTPDEAASRVLAFLDSTPLKNGGVYDVRDSH